MVGATPVMIGAGASVRLHELMHDVGLVIDGQLGNKSVSSTGLHTGIVEIV